MSREVILDTETTGLDVAGGHRVIEIGCVEMIDGARTGRTFHSYLNPGRPIDPDASAIHGITDQDIADAPRFSDIGLEFINFIHGSVLVIHNAPFDIGFLDQEMRLAGSRRGLSAFVIDEVDTLTLARELHPGQRNDLNSLCRRYGISTEHRTAHGALVDAELLAEVYSALRVYQPDLDLGERPVSTIKVTRDASVTKPLRVIEPSPEELEAHNKLLDELDKQCADGSIWRREPMLR